MKKSRNFFKMHGLGNEICVLDMRNQPNYIDSKIALQLQEAGIAFDQIMVIYDAKKQNTSYYIETINRDGSSSATCGNGIRCVAYALSKESNKTLFTFQTPAGNIKVEKNFNNLFSVNMGKPKFFWKDIPLTHRPKKKELLSLQEEFKKPILATSPSFASIGNPHAIFWCLEDIYSYDLSHCGPLLEKHPLFPKRANITLAYILSNKKITIRTWERGAGLTQSCGSAACATAVSAMKKNYTCSMVNVETPGGSLHIEWKKNKDIIMTGPAEEIFSGSFNLDTYSVTINLDKTMSNLS